MALSTGARDRGRELAQRRRDAELARQEYLADLHPACPHEGLPGTYIGTIGMGTIGAADAETSIRLAFRCPNGDTFAYGSQAGDVWPIAPADEQFVRPEPLDRLDRGGANHEAAPERGRSSAPCQDDSTHRCGVASGDGARRPIMDAGTCRQCGATSAQGDQGVTRDNAPHGAPYWLCQSHYVHEMDRQRHLTPQLANNTTDLARAMWTRVTGWVQLRQLLTR